MKSWSWLEYFEELKLSKIIIFRKNSLEKILNKIRKWK